MIIDYSVARPTIAELKALHVTHAGRYIGWDSVPGYPSIGKNLSTAEAKTLLGAGIGIFLAFEYTADAALSGAAQGTKDAKLAAQQLHDLGAPHGMTVYWALDFDIRDYAPGSKDPAAKLGPAADYFHAVNAEKLPYATGIYGGYYAVSRALDARLATMGWQTIAWSGGQWDKRAKIRQEVAQLLGGDVDILSSAHEDFGQWPRPAVPKTGPFEHTTAGHLSLADLAAQHKETPAQIIRDTIAHATPEQNDAFGETLNLMAHAYRVRMPAGLHLWLRRTP